MGEPPKKKAASYWNLRLCSGARVETAPVVYAALEGEGGFKVRTAAWEANRGQSLPDDLHLMLQPFKLTETTNEQDLAAVVSAVGVVIVDTLNRAAPTADENSSRDMGEILEATKRQQTLTDGLVILVYLTGKDETLGLQGHSSLFAALDTVVTAKREGDHRERTLSKSKDGVDGQANLFKLLTESLGIDEHGDPLTCCEITPGDEPPNGKKAR
jgi:putative DNA primase/helicase